MKKKRFKFRIGYPLLKRYNNCHIDGTTNVGEIQHGIIPFHPLLKVHTHVILKYHSVRELGSHLATNGILQDLLEFVIPG